MVTTSSDLHSMSRIYCQLCKGSDQKRGSMLIIQGLSYAFYAGNLWHGIRRGCRTSIIRACDYCSAWHEPRTKETILKVARLNNLA